MLTSLTVKQFALIEKAELELEPGMTVFTGETGAGKSMLVDALGAAFGSRANIDWVRHGAERAEVVAVWCGEDARINALLLDQDIEIEDELVLRRVIGADGRSRAYINGTVVSLKVLQSLGQVCLDLHGQHEHQVLMKSGFQQSLLDARVPLELRKRVEGAFQGWRQAKVRLDALQSERGETEQQAEWMRDELSRLQVLEIEPNLSDTLQAEVDAGRHYAQIQKSASEAMLLLDEAEPNARGLIARAGHAVEGAAPFHEGLKAAVGLIEQIDTLIGEVTPELQAALDTSFDEHRLQQQEERLMQLHEAKRRHGCDESELLALMNDWQTRLSALDTAGWDEASLSEAVEKAEADFVAAASQLTEARQACGEGLGDDLRPFMDRLALDAMQVRFDVSSSSEQAAWHADGWDCITMQAMSNPGEPWRDLASVASGGELSRLVLALKGCGALANAPHIAVFDEVDSGIGGETAWCVGELLSLMARERQVLVISHLPQVASCADHQVVISKREQGERTLTTLNPLEEGHRKQEIARMLGGVDDESCRHAEAMLERARAARVQ